MSKMKNLTVFEGQFESVGFDVQINSSCTIKVRIKNIYKGKLQFRFS